MTALEFWAKPHAWPRDPLGYVFLARAVEEVGRALFGEHWTAKEVTTDPIGPYMIAASPRAGAAGLSGTTSAPVATCPAREDALDAQRVRTMTAEDEGPALEDSGPRVCGGSRHPIGMAAYTSVHGRHAEVRPCVRRRCLRAWCGLLHERIHWSGAMVAASHHGAVSSAIAATARAFLNR